MKYTYILLLSLVGICASCHVSHFDIKTKYHILDLTGIEDKEFIVNKTSSLDQSNFENLISLKSRCDSIFIYSYIINAVDFIQVSNSLSFPDLPGMDPLLQSASGYIMPINSSSDSKDDVRINLFVKEYWADRNYSGIWIILIHKQEITNFIVVQQLDEMELFKSWDHAISLLDKLNIVTNN